MGNKSDLPEKRQVSNEEGDFFINMKIFQLCNAIQELIELVKKESCLWRQVLRQVLT